MAAHKGNKYNDLEPGLYVRVPSGDETKMVVYKSPFIQAEKLDRRALGKLMDETRSL